MFRPRNAILVAGVLAVAALPASAPAATKTVSHKVKSGSTTLKLSSASISNLAAMGVTMVGTPPASTVNNVLAFPVKSGTTIKTKGSNKVVGGKIVEQGALQMSNGTTTTVALSTLTTTFGKTPVVLSGKFGNLSINVANLVISASKTKITKKDMKITGVQVRLTAEAAGSMNAIFNVTGFKANDLVGTATMIVKFK